MSSVLCIGGFGVLGELRFFNPNQVHEQGLCLSETLSIVTYYTRSVSVWYLLDVEFVTVL